ncbi:glycoside hydrolase family 32 protein [Paenibacillus sp. CF384]|uniref:glycoside hydrolase family 32 protein n=1 Tax=Paenibacillus sp. CF384 TaxID=1884382 RepID=UPI000898EA16|nr:glycoside hydrolase family 32 protein [Paenibacillus sp. CF384]SDX08981.1 beta-fructofuranosidase [Paenibacillus sp. CF384]
MNLYRPIYHFLPPGNWMNDPNGLLYYQGEYHVFYQYNPNGDTWGTIHWGHAKSRDLIHWEHLPVALTPSTEQGEEHCFSGCAVLGPEGVPTLFYTSIGSSVERGYEDGAEQWMAVSTDGMMTWHKYPGNPVLSKDIHGELNIRDWRDPYIWKHGESWLMVIGGKHNGKGCAMIYGSDDLKSWKLLNKLMEAQRTEEYLWECPIFFPLDGKYVLIYSPKDAVRYYTGTFNDDFTFTPERHGILDPSGWEGFYAPNVMEDGEGRKLLWAWMPEFARGQFDGAKGWAGALTLPRELSLTASGALRMEPAKELKQLRGAYESTSNLTLSGGQTCTLNTRGRAFELLAEIEWTDADSTFGFKLLHGEDDEEATLILFDPSQQRFTIDRSRSSLSPSTHRMELQAEMNWQAGDTTTVHIFLDHSLLEVFASYESCISTRMYPLSEDSDRISVIAGSGSVTFRSLQVWTLPSIWPEQHEPG